MTAPTVESRVAASFAANVAAHQLTVLHEDGLYRHLRFRQPDQSAYWFDLVTWPGHLAITGDMDGHVFARIADMFEFFRGHEPNPQYWAEKIVSGREGVRRHSEDKFRQHVIEYVGGVEDQWPGLLEAVKAELLDPDFGPDLSFEGPAREALNDFVFTPAGAGHDPQRFRFEDAWEWDLTEWSYSFLWRCHAIPWGIAKYDAHKAGTS